MILPFVMAALTAMMLLGTPATAPAPTPGPSSSATASAPVTLPNRQQWLRDVTDVLAKAPDYVRQRAQDAAPGDRLALNLDIDNTSIASSYGGGPIPEVLALTRLAQRHDVSILFNTARIDTHYRRTLAQLKSAGYHVDSLCMRRGGETRVQSKQRCRSKYADAGYTLIANLGNNTTDFVGRGYERAFRLPNYDGLLP